MCCWQCKLLLHSSFIDGFVMNKETTNIAHIGYNSNRFQFEGGQLSRRKWIECFFSYVPFVYWSFSFDFATICSLVFSSAVCTMFFLTIFSNSPYCMYFINRLSIEGLFQYFYSHSCVHRHTQMISIVRCLFDLLLGFSNRFSKILFEINRTRVNFKYLFLIQP